MPEEKTERDPSQEWFWSEEWQAGEQEAEADIEDGRVSEFDTVDDLIAALYSGRDENDTGNEPEKEGEKV